jgi:hypothetical protein
VYKKIFLLSIMTIKTAAKNPFLSMQLHSFQQYAKQARKRTSRAAATDHHQQQDSNNRTSSRNGILLLKSDSDISSCENNSPLSPPLECRNTEVKIVCLSDYDSFSYLKW